MSKFKTSASSIEPCYPNLSAIPVQIEGVVSVVPKSQTLDLAREAYSLNINQFWMQKHSETQEAIDFCNLKGMNTIAGHCILMFIPPVKSIHKIHRNIKRFFGAMPR